MITESFKCLSRKFKGYFKEVSRKVQGSFIEVSGVFQDSFMGVSTKIEASSFKGVQEYLKEI